VYERAREVRWRELFSAERTFKVETNAHRSPVKSLDFVTLRVKDAIATSASAASRASTSRRGSASSRRRRARKSPSPSFRSTAPTCTGAPSSNRA
jgi:putative N6-adenine-specific DNA methylase